MTLLKALAILFGWSICLAVWWLFWAYVSVDPLWPLHSFIWSGFDGMILRLLNIIVITVMLIFCWIIVEVESSDYPE